MNIMDRKELIEKYMEAETTGAEESMLAESFASEPPRDEEERKVEAILKAFRPALPAPLPDGEEEYDRMIREARRRAVLGWAAGLSGVAAAVAAVILLTGRPALQEPASSPMDILEQLKLISNLDPAEAGRYEFKPVGDGFIMTAVYDDGQTASFILTPIDGGDSFAMLSLRD